MISLGMISEDISQLSKVTDLKLENNPWTRGYEHEIWSLPTLDRSETRPGQMTYWSMKEDDLKRIVKDAVFYRRYRTLKYIAFSKNVPNIFMDKENNINGGTLLKQMCTVQPLLVHKMFTELPSKLSTADDAMYENSSFDYVASVDYCIRGSKDVLIDPIDFWSSKIKKYNKSEIRHVIFDCLSFIAMSGYEISGLGTVYSVLESLYCRLAAGLGKNVKKSGLGVVLTGLGNICLNYMLKIKIFRKKNKDESKVYAVDQDTFMNSTLSKGTDIVHYDTTMSLMMHFYESHLPMVSYTLPLQFMSSDHFLKAYVYIADQTGKYDHFDNENVKAAVVSAWETRGFLYHLRFCVYYMLYLALLSYSNYCYQMEVAAESVAIVVLFMSCVLLLVETSQYVNLGFYSFVFDVQNWLEVISCVFVIAGTSKRLENAHDSVTTEILMAIGTVLAWFNALNLLRPFSYTGPLIQMMYTVTAKIIPFFIILMVVIFGFSQAFFLLARESDPDFDTVLKSYLYSFVYISGSPQYVITGGDSNDLRTVVEVLYVAFTQIMLLNLLIAFLNHIYSDIQDQGESVGSYERCKMIISHLRMRNDGDQWIHYIKNEINVENYDQDKVNKDYTNSKIKDDLQVAEKNQKESFDLLDTKIDDIRKSIGKIFSDQKDDNLVSASQSRKSFISERRISNMSLNETLNETSNETLNGTLDLQSNKLSGKNVMLNDSIDTITDDSVIDDTNHDIKWLEMRLDNIEKDRKKDFQELRDMIQGLSPSKK